MKTVIGVFNFNTIARYTKIKDIDKQRAFNIKSEQNIIEGDIIVIDPGLGEKFEFVIHIVLDEEYLYKDTTTNKLIKKVDCVPYHKLRVIEIFEDPTKCIAWTGYIK